MKVVACWPKFGPYHRARLEAVARGAEFDLIGLETNPADATYGWADDAPAERSWTHATVRGGDVAAALDAARPDAVFINGWGFADSRRALAWAARRRTPTAVFSDSRASDKRRRPVVERIKRSVLRLCDAALAAGPEHADYLTACGMPADRVFLGYDAVDNAHFARAAAAARANPAARADLRLPAGEYFLAVGRFVPKKNFLALVAAYDRCRAAGATRWPLVIVGAGVLAGEITAATARSPCAADIRVLPFLQYDQLPAAYAHAACLAVPSLEDEQWGLVVNEAMAAGLPVLVSTACGCAPSLVREGENGFLLEPRDVDQMAATLARFAALSVADRAAMGRRSAALVSDWSLERFASSFIASAQVAVQRPRPKRWFDRLVAQALAR